MSWCPTVLTEAIRAFRTWRLNPFKALKRIMPRGLFGRSLIIIVAPVVMLQAIVTYAFFERHYDIVTSRLARGVAADVAFLVSIENAPDLAEERERLRMTAARALQYSITHLPGDRLPPDTKAPSSTLDEALQRYLESQIAQDMRFDTERYPDFAEIRVQIDDGVLRLLVPRKRLEASNVDIFILWMTGSSLVLLAVAIIFLRNQVKPIERLAFAAESFGKGRAVPDFKPYGATEVRSAAQAFLQMRERIERHVQQRTEMLAGVSHDLKTPLTRIKLQLAMMEGSPDTEAIKADIVEMGRMLDEYLDFARGEGGEAAGPSNIAALVSEAAETARGARGASPDRVRILGAKDLALTVKRNALKRCITNLIDNALKHGTHADVTARRNGRMVELIVDDDGPGIPESRREEAFRPFHRLDEGRNLQTGGVGLGLAIARDIARAHGGDVVLEASPLGGLRALVKLPV